MIVGPPTIQTVTVQAPAPSRYDHLLEVFRRRNPASMIEIGVWRGDRTMQFLAQDTTLRRYVGFDLFEGMTDGVYQAESMGNCLPHSEAWVKQRIDPAAKARGCSVQLVAGSTTATLTEFAERHTGEFDFIYIDGGHSLETIASDWAASRRLLSREGIAVFDDYYLNDTSRGAKPLIDGLLADPDYEVRFFPVVEDIVENLQITMVTVRPKSR
jgi:hypothetical protein